MGFNPGINVGDELTNSKMCELFKCGNMGGMRRSTKTGTLVIVSDDTKGLYRDVWKNGVLHYTGMGKVGDQVLSGNQNGTLFDSNRNGVEVHLFEVLKKAVYTYRGIVKLIDEPYKGRQPDDNGNMRDVWIFPVMPVSEAVQAISHELTEPEIAELTDEELARITFIKNVNRKPKTTETVVYYRDPYLKQMVKRLAEGKCQFCKEDAPFIDKQGEPYLEEHHVTRLADGGKDEIDNVVAICPNCHRRIHVLEDDADATILEEIARQNKDKLETLAGRFGSYRKEYIGVYGK